VIEVVLMIEDSESAMDIGKIGVASSTGWTTTTTRFRTPKIAGVRKVASEVAGRWSEGGWEVAGRWLRGGSTVALGDVPGLFVRGHTYDGVASLAMR
jgi:hypothetical protein